MQFFSLLDPEAPQGRTDSYTLNGKTLIWLLQGSIRITCLSCLLVKMLQFRRGRPGAQRFKVWRLLQHLLLISDQEPLSSMFHLTV